MSKQEVIAVSHKGVAAALAAAQAQMGKALKSASNPHFRSRYADLASVMDACLPALNANGIAVVQPTIDDESGRYVETILIHGETDTELKCRVPLIVQKNDMQGYGSAVTYARRYGLMSMAGIAPEDDDGNAAAKAAPKGEDRKPSGPPPEAIEAACDSLSEADNFDQLRAIWTGLPGPVRSIQMVEAVKDQRKAQLQQMAETDAAHDAAVKGDDLQDEIPY
jgi:hypothetical protein